MAENTQITLNKADTGVNIRSTISDLSSLEGWKYRIASIPPGTGEIDVELGGQKYTLYRPDARRIQAIILGELKEFESIEAFYAVIHPQVEKTSQGAEDISQSQDTPFEEYRNLILTIPRGQGKGGVIINGKSYTIQRKPFGEEIDVLIDGKFINYPSISDFLEALGIKKHLEAQEKSTETEASTTMNIPRELLYPKRGDIIELDGKSYRYIGMGERWQVQDRGVDWKQIDYVTGPYFTQSELKEKFIEATKISVQEKVKKLSSDEKSDNEKLIEAFEKQIQMAKDLIETGVDNLGKVISLTDKLGIGETIKKMELEVEKLRKKLQKKEEHENQNEKKEYPIILGTNNYPLVPFKKEDESKEIDSRESEKPKGTDGEKPNAPKEKGVELPPDYSFIPKGKKLRTNISDVSVNLYEIADARAQERLRTEYGEGGFFTKAKSFFTRAKLLEKYREGERKKLEKDGMFDTSTDHIRSHAADRFGLSNEVTGTNDIVERAKLEIPELNRLARDYIVGTIGKGEFQRDVEALTESNEELKTALSGITQLGSNIMKYVEVEKEFFLFLRDLPNDREIIKAYLDSMVRTNLQLRRALESSLGLNYEKNFDQIVFLLSQTQVRTLLQNQELQIELSVLTGGEAAFAINPGEKTDTKSYKIGKWLQKHPVISSLGTAFGITASSLAMGPIGNLVSGTLGIGGINSLRRNAEYTDEHTGFEKRITQGTHLDAEIYRKVEELTREFKQSTGLKKRWIGFQLKRAEAKLAMYQTQGVGQKKQENGNTTIEGRNGTTHRHFASIASLNRKLYAYITEKEGFSLEGEAGEKNKKYLESWITQGIARIDTWKETGHNFLKSSDEDSLEADYNILYENLLSASTKIGVTFEELRNSEIYKNIKTGLIEDLGRAKKSFEKSRTKTSIKTGVIHGSIYGASSIVFQWLAGTGLFDSTRTIPGKPTFAAGGVVVDPAIAGDLKRVLGANAYDAFVKHLSESTTPDTLWDTLVNDILQNKAVGNDIKNQIMTFILNATDIQNGITKPELLIEAAKQGLFQDIANNSSNIDRVLSLMHKWGYGSIDKTWLIDTLRGIDAGTIQTHSLTPLEQTKIAESLWCYVHRDGAPQGSPLWQVFMDKLPDIRGKLPDTTTVEKGGEWLRYLAIPTWKNTFLSRKYSNLVDESGKFIHIPQKEKYIFSDGFREFVPEREREIPPESKPPKDGMPKKEEKGTPDDGIGEKKPITKKIVTRGDKKEIDDRDINPEYPVPFEELTESQVITYMLKKAPVFLGEDQYSVQLFRAGKMNLTEMTARLQISLKQQRAQFEKSMPQFEKELEGAHKNIMDIFEKYNLPKERIMPYDQFRKNTRFYTFYEFMANYGDMDKSKALSVKGYNRMVNGEIGFNMFGLGQMTFENQLKYIRHVAVHELLHGTAVNNYFETDSGERSTFTYRRSGVRMVNGKNRERGVALNEGIVETIAYKTMCSLYGEEYSKEGDQFYKSERRLVATLVKNYGIDEGLFVRAAYERNGLKVLARALEGPNLERKGFLSLIIALMDIDVDATISFLNGGKFLLYPHEYKKYFPASLIPNGQLPTYLGSDYRGIWLKSENT